MEDNLQQIQESGVGVNPIGNDESSSESIVPRVRIQIPVAVYTATMGYGWSKLPISLEEARDLWKKIRKKVKEVVGDELLGEIAYGDSLYGVLYDGGDYAVAFRLQSVENWDQSNRDADYCACAFVSKEQFADINFEKLLEHVYFHEPTHAPGDSIDYVVDDSVAPTEEDIGDCLQKMVDDSYEDKDYKFDWRMIGPVLAAFGDRNSRWWFSCLRSKGGEQICNEYGKWDKSLFKSENDKEEERHSDDSGADMRISSECLTMPSFALEHETKPSNKAQPISFKSLSLGGLGDAGIERANKEIEELRRQNKELSACLSSQRESYKFMEREHRQELLQKDARIEELSHSVWLYSAVAFLLGLVVAGLACLGTLWFSS